MRVATAQGVQSSTRIKGAALSKLCAASADEEKYASTMTTLASTDRHRLALEINRAMQLHYLEAQVVCLVHQELDLFSTLQDTLYVIYHDVLDLIHL